MAAIPGMSDRAAGEALIDLLRRDTARKSRRKKWGKFLGILFVVVCLHLLRGLYLMLAVGIAHAGWIPQLPTIGYWWAVLIQFLVGGALARSGWPKSKEGS